MFQVIRFSSDNKKNGKIVRSFYTLEAAQCFLNNLQISCEETGWKTMLTKDKAVLLTVRENEMEVETYAIKEKEYD